MTSTWAAGRLDVAMPAGGRVRPDRVRGMGTEYKPLARLGNEYLSQRAIRNLRQWPRVNRIALAAPPPVLSEIGALADRAVEDHGSGPANLQACLEALDLPPWVLLAGCDTPFISADVGEQFLERCPAEADLCFSYVAAERYEAEFPGSPYLALPLRGGRIVFGSLHLARTSVLQGRRDLFERAFSARKKPWRMARLIGLSAAVKFATRRLTLGDVEARVGRLLGCACVGVESPDAAIAFDVDKPDHLLDAHRFLANYP